MIVLDASVVVELLTNGVQAESIRQALSESDEPSLVPYLLDIEVLSAIRGLVAGRRLDSFGIAQLINELSTLPAERYPHTPLFTRIWELRHNFTAYDATYIALAELTGSVLYTCDESLRRGHRARVRLFQQ